LAVCAYSGVNNRLQVLSHFCPLSLGLFSLGVNGCSQLFTG